MINVNSNLKNAITGKGSQLIKITGSCYDTSNVYHSFTWTNADIVQGSFYVDKRCISGSQFSFGNTVSNELGFELFGAYEDWLLENTMVTVSLGGYVSGTATYFEVGKFILEKPAQDMDRLTCHGYDLLTKLDVNADNWVMNVNSGENILGQAVKPSPTYLMNADGYQNYIAGSVTTPYYNSNPLSAATGMIPFVQNGHAPRKIVIKATGNTVVLNDSYFIVFWYNAGNLEVVSGLTWAFDWSGYYSSTTVSSDEYHIDFVVDPGHTKTKVQEYLETQFGVTDCYVAFTLATSTMGNFTSIEVSYGSASTAKIGDTVDEICTACGLEFIAGYPAPDNLVEVYTNLADYSQYSYRTILGLFAQACGANLTLWPSGYGVYDGQIRFAIPTASGVTLDETKVLSCELADEPVLINGARFVSSSGALFINTTDNTQPYKYFDFTGCPVFPRDAQTAVDNIAAFTGSSNTWLPGKAKILAMPWLEPMDIVNFAYSVKPNYTGKFLITRVRIGANGATYIESAGFNQSSTNSSGYVPTDYTEVAPFGLVYSTYSETVTPGNTSNVAISTFTHNMPTPNEYVVADSGFGIVTDVNGSFAEVLWLAVYSGGGGTITDYIHDGNYSTAQYRKGGLVIGAKDSTEAGGINVQNGRIYVVGNSNPLFGLKSNVSGATQFFLQVTKDHMYVGPTSSLALDFAATGNTTLPKDLTVKGKIIKNGGTSSQFLKADGSVDSNTYVAESSGTCTLTDGNAYSFTANYHKLGKQVTVYGTFPTGGTATSLSGLPYAAAAGVQDQLMFQHTMMSTEMVIAKLGVSGSTLTTAGYVTLVTGSTTADTTGSWLGNIPSGGVPFSITYITT